MNALEDEAQAEKILQWLKKEINEAWEKREEIEPSFECACSTSNDGDSQTLAKD